MSFLVGNEAVIRNFKKLRSQIDYGIFYPVQYGAIAALTGPDNMVLEQCEEYEKRRNALCDGFTAIGWKFDRSEGTMFAWAKIPESFGADDVRFVTTLLEKTGVLLLRQNARRICVLIIVIFHISTVQQGHTYLLLRCVLD